jgi:hypothetical protein
VCGPFRDELTPLSELKDPEVTPWEIQGREIQIAVGTHIAMRPPHKAVRAAFPHTVSTLGI